MRKDTGQDSERIAWWSRARRSAENCRASDADVEPAGKELLATHRIVAAARATIRSAQDDGALDDAAIRDAFAAHGLLT